MSLSIKCTCNNFLSIFRRTAPPICYLIDSSCMPSSLYTPLVLCCSCSTWLFPFCTIYTYWTIFLRCWLQASIVDMTVTIPHHLHNSIIGPKGKLVRSVMDECGGVRIVFPSSESGSDKVKLHGPKEDVEKANSMLLELADEQVGRVQLCLQLLVSSIIMVILVHCMYGMIYSVTAMYIIILTCTWCKCSSHMFFTSCTCFFVLIYFFNCAGGRKSYYWDQLQT